MNYIEYGKDNKNVIVLLHGGGLSWWNYLDVANELKADYHIILVILDGHAGCDRPFTTIEDNALEIVDFIDRHFNGSVLLIGGLSLGGQILLDILSYRKNICQYAMIESALIKPSKLTYALIKPVFGSCFGLIRQKWFAKLQFASLKIKDDLFEMYFKDTVALKKHDMIAFLEANASYKLKDSIKENLAQIYIYAGAKENTSILKSAKEIHKVLMNSTLNILPSLYHGEFSINYGHDYAKAIKRITQKS